MASVEHTVVYVMFFWRWLALLLILAAIAFGLSYKWKLAMDVSAGAIGAFLGIILMSLLVSSVIALVLKPFYDSFVEKGADHNHVVVAITFLAAIIQPVAMFIGGIGGCVSGIGMLRWSRWRLGRVSEVA